MAYVHQTPTGMRKPKKKGGSGGAASGRAKAWFERKCSCGHSQRTALGRRIDVCAKCKKEIPGPWD